MCNSIQPYVLEKKEIVLTLKLKQILWNGLKQPASQSVNIAPLDRSRTLRIRKHVFHN